MGNINEPIDRATAYARGVVAGDIIAGPLVRGACKRHLDDLKRGHSRGLVWKPEEAAKGIRFYEEVLKLNGGQFEGQPFKLLSWQAFIVGSLYGWYGVDGFRRFRVAYVETGKGSGKSPLAAGIGMKGLVADQEPRAEIYAAATKKDQAMILFRDAVAMYEHSPKLRERLTRSGVGERTWNLAFIKQGSFFRPISADDNTQSGPRPHISLVDEVHEHKDNTLIEMLRAGTKSRRNPLLFLITNSGTNKQGPAWAYHEVAEKIVKGEATDDAFFFYVCALDEGEEEGVFDNEACWPKVNPSLQEADLPGYKYLREQVTEARNMPSKESIVRRLNFCIWTGAESPWLSEEVWKGARREYDIESLRGRRAVAALDLSSTTDLCALSFCVEPVDEGEPYKLVSFAFLPELGLEERVKKDRVPYDKWAEAGLVTLTPGRAISKRVVLQKLSAMCEFFDVLEFAYDRWRIEDLVALANDEGITLPDQHGFGQGFKDMAPAIDTFEEMLLNGELVHDGHKVLTMCVGNAVTEEDAAGNRKLSKDKATGRIDLGISSVMAVDRAKALLDGVAPGIQTL